MTEYEREVYNIYLENAQLKAELEKVKLELRQALRLLQASDTQAKATNSLLTYMHKELQNDRTRD